MKRILSALLVICLLVPLTATAFAKKNCDCGHSPVIYVHGFGGSLYNTETGKRVYAPESEAYTAVLPQIIGASLALVGRAYPLFCTLAMQAAMSLLGEVACDETGEPLYPTGPRGTALPNDDVHGKYNVNGIADYAFNYDWRLDPMDTAAKLHTYVEHVKKLTGHDKVSIVVHSMGSIVLASYLYLYGADSVDAAVFLAPAFGGVSIMGSLLSGEADISDKSEELSLFLQSQPSITDARIKTLVRVCGKLGLFRPILRWLQGALDSQFDRAYRECLRPLFVTMPGLWAFVSDEYYERAKAFSFSDDPQLYATLINRIDRYHNEVHLHLADILRNAQAQGVRLSIVSGYGISSLPLSRAHTQQSDFLITTVCSSLGASAAPFGSALPTPYTQTVADGHEHVSPDGLVDASTCLFPERTWFVRSLMHFDYPHENAAFVRWLLEQPADTTVFTDPNYPQFLLQDGHDLRPVTE